MLKESTYQTPCGTIHYWSSILSLDTTTLVFLPGLTADHRLFDKQVAYFDGVYVSPDTWTDAMYLLHLRCGQAVFSHETALFFHDLTDREPLKYTITVRNGYNPSRLQEDGFQVYTVKKDLHEIGITTMLTSFGHSVPVYDMERTICDLLRSRKNIEMQVFQDALKQYAKRKDKNLRMLMKYAAMFHVEKILRPYLEVLL